MVAPSPAAAQSGLRLALDSLAYSDTDNVIIVSPQLSVSYELDSDGGAITGRGAVDVVSAASVDVVSHATSRFREVRYEGDFNLRKAFGDHLPSLGYRVSVEPDYVSHGVSTGLSSRLGSSDTVLSVSYGLTLDRIGRSGTPWSAFSRRLTSHAAELSVTQVLSPQAVIRVVGSLTIQHGYQEKPYRYVPLFDANGIARAGRDGVHLDLDTFDAYRLNERPPEEVPDLRLRPSAAVRIMRFLPRANGSFRLDYRFYADDWSVVSHTLEPGFESTFGGGWFAGGWLRFYLQNAASFWRRVYVVEQPDVVPRYRTMDRDLAPYVALTGGLRTGYRGERFEAYLEGSVAQTWYSDYLFLDHVTAIIGQGGLRVDL